MSLATQVLIGFLIGVASGVFFGGLIAPVGIAGDAFIRLLQMTVLPYVVVSLVLGLGRLTPNQAGKMIRPAGALLLVLWALSLLFVLMMPLAYPAWESGAYFSTALVDPTPELGLINLFIPANPFNALATGLVPAVVVFSLALGAALMGIDDKQGIIDALGVVSAALSRVAQWIVKLAPLGVFAVTARAAGTLDVSELRALEVYLATYTAIWLVMVLWFLPALAASLTPLKYREIMGPARDALVTAFATGSVFVVLPILAERVKHLVRRSAPESNDAENAVDVLIPMAFTFPGPGTLLILGFIPFAAWLSGVAVTAAEMPGFLFSGMFSLFGSTMVAVPFLLDQLRIPADLFQLYVVSDVFTGRFGMLASAIFSLTWCTLGACAIGGAVRVRRRSLMKLGIATAGMAIVGLLAVRMFFSYAVSYEYRAGSDFLDRELLTPSPEMTQLVAADVRPDSLTSASTLERIRSRGSIRVGYRPNQLPFAFENSAGQLVGHDIDLAHHLAADLGVRLEVVAIERTRAVEMLSNGAIDLLLSGVVITPERALAMDFSAPYMDQTLAFIVADHRRAEFSTHDSVLQLRDLTVAVPNVPYFRERASSFPNIIDVEVVESPRQFFAQADAEYDALIFTAEAGSAWTLVHPEYSVVVPQPNVHRVPVACAVAAGDERMRGFLNSWLDFTRSRGALSKLYDYWILGRTERTGSSRWSVLRDMLGWID